MNLTKNGIASACWKTYQTCKESGEGTKTLVAMLANAIYLGAALEKKAEREGAAENTFLLSTMQATFLRKNREMVITQRLVFNETSEQSIRSMSGAMVTGSRMQKVEGPDGTPGRKIILVKDDGDSEFLVSAYDPAPEIEAGMVYWIAEPFVAKDGDTEGVVLSAMKPEDREKVNAAIRPASNFPRYLQRRRLIVNKVTVGTDWRNAWLEYHIGEIEPYDQGQAGLELEKLRAELMLTAEEASDGEEHEEQPKDETPKEEGNFVDTNAVDVSPIEP